MQWGSHAVVVGGGLAGLTSARVLSDHFERVTLVERDRYPAEPGLRPGVPQGFQGHLLLARGRELLMSLFPELDAALVAADSPEHDILEGWRLEFAAGGLARCGSGCKVRGVSRVRLEHEVRRLVAALPNVGMIENARASGLIPNADGSGVRGLRLECGRGTDVEVPTELEAALIVDASGRGSRGPQWLQSLGFEAPKTTCVNSRLSYSARWYRDIELPAAYPGGVLTGTRAPSIPRAGGVMRVEGGRFITMIVNMGSTPAPTGDDEYVAFSRTLPTPSVYDAIRTGTPLGPARGYQRTDNQWRDYSGLARLPEGFVPLGDAVCAFNPFYAQGMTVATLQAILLGEELRKGPKNLARRVQHRFRPAIHRAWQLATGEDYRWSFTEGPPASFATRVGNAYTDHVVEVATRSVPVARTFIEVVHMKRPARALLGPHVLFPVLGRLLRGAKTAQASARMATAE